MLIGAGIGIPFQQNVLARLLGSAEFFAPLTHSAIPTRAAFGTTATFTRATPKTVENNDGYLVTLLSGEIGFPGARRVRNLFVTTTADMSNAAWTKSNISVATGQLDPDGGTTAMKLVESSGASVIPQISQTGNCVAGNRTIMWIVAKAAERSWLVINNNQGTGGGSIRVWFNLAAGTVGTVTAGGTAAITSLGDGWYLCSVSAVIANGSDCVHVYQVTNADGVNTYAGDGTSGIYVWHPQLEDVTAQTTQTAGEYVSVGVASAPYYHGSMVDGVKCFPTDLAGNALTTMRGYSAEGARTNLVWPSEDLTHVRYVSGGGGIAVVADQAVAPDGTTTADQLTASGANGTLIQDLGVIASAAQAFSLYLKRKTGTGNIDITLDGGATWTTQAITTTEWTRCQITQTVANPDVGVRIVTSGDAIYAWGLQCE